MKGVVGLVLLLGLTGCGDRVAVSAPTTWTGTWRDPAGRGFLTIGGDTVTCALDGLPPATWTMTSAVERPEVPGAGTIEAADGTVMRLARGSAGVRGVKVAMLDIDIIRKGAATTRFRLYADTQEAPSAPGKAPASPTASIGKPVPLTPPVAPSVPAPRRPATTPAPTPAPTPVAASDTPRMPHDAGGPTATPPAMAAPALSAHPSPAIVQPPQSPVVAPRTSTEPAEPPSTERLNPSYHDDGRNAAFRSGTPERMRQATTDIIAAATPAQAHAVWLSQRRVSYQQAISAAASAAALAGASDDAARRSRALAGLDAVLADLLLHERAYQTWRAEGPP